MFDNPRVLSFATTGILALSLGQGVALAQQPAPAPVTAPPAAAAPAAGAINPADAARDRAEERRAMWEEWQEMHDAQCEHMKKMTPEERRAQREAFWKERRERAAERGIELPETPPWVAAEQRRKAAKERYEQYRKTVESMTEEQREAARALFGPGGPQGPGPDWAPPQMHPWGYGPQGGYMGQGYNYGYAPTPGVPGSMGLPPMPYGQDDPTQAPPSPPAN